jgi:hypothetical protein
MEDLKSFINFSLSDGKVPWVFIAEKTRTAQNVDNLNFCTLKFKILILLANDIYNRKFQEALELTRGMDEEEDGGNVETRWNALVEMLKKNICQTCAGKAGLNQLEFILCHEDYVKNVNRVRSALKAPDSCCRNSLFIPHEMPEKIVKVDQFQKEFIEKNPTEDYFFAMQIWSEENARFEIDIYTRNEKKMVPLINFLTEEFF